MTVIPIVIGVLGTVSKGLEERLKDLDSEEESIPSRKQHCKDSSEWKRIL